MTKEVQQTECKNRQDTLQQHKIVKQTASKIRLNYPEPPTTRNKQKRQK